MRVLICLFVGLIVSVPALAQDFDGDGYTVAGGDCDDTDPGVNPAAVEVVGDSRDQDCDGGELCYIDADDDGARDALSTSSVDADCTDVYEGEVSDPLDCDDSDPTTHPGAHEICNGLDNDCDGVVDDACEALLDLGPPQPGLAGQQNTWLVTGATPGAPVHLAAGTTPGMTMVPGCPGAFIELAGPVIVGSAVADLVGDASIIVSVPALVSGATVIFQVAEPTSCRVSHHELEHTFP